jgi:hypothetical protein
MAKSVLDYIYIARFLYQVLVCSQKCEGIKNFLLSYPVYSQIWLNATMDPLNGKRSLNKIK